MRLFEKKGNVAGEKEGAQVLYYEGQAYDGETLLVSIFKKATDSILVVDDRLSIRTLSLIKAAGKNVPVVLYSDNTEGPEMLTRAALKEFFARNAAMRFLIGTIAGKVKDRYIILDNDTPEEKVYLLSSSIAGNDNGCVIRKMDTGFVKGMLEELQGNSYLILK